MDIQENKEQLGEMEPSSEEMGIPEEVPATERNSSTDEENLDPSQETEAVSEPGIGEEGGQQTEEQNPESEPDSVDEHEEPPRILDAEDVAEEESVLEELPADQVADAVEDGGESVQEAMKIDLEEESQPETATPDPYAALKEEPENVPDDGRAWYVVHCYSGNEDKVRHNIMQRIESMSMDNLIFDVVVPTEDEVNIKNGERQTVEKKVFPGYILVNMILTEESWYMVRNTPGVTGFVGMGNDPTPLQPEEVARILKRMESESPRINVTFRAGERVRIVDGPFEDFYGKVAEIDMERATVRVMVNFFGRETPVELDFLQVEQA